MLCPASLSDLGVVFRRFAGWLLPNKRPMDNMAAGWDRPQEDEFALLTMGLPSPYRRMAFPNDPPVHMDYLDFEGVAEEEIQDWMQSLRSFLLTVATTVDSIRTSAVSAETTT